MPTRARSIRRAITLFLVAGATLANTTSSGTQSKTIGLVLTHFGYSFHETSGGKFECPAGFNAETLEQFRAQFPTEAEQNRQFQVAMDFQARAPGGLNTTYNPDLAGPEPIPAKYVLSDIGTGLNLDGRTDGAETPRTCAHKNFTSPRGEAGIDNQLYRVLGCVSGLRSSGFHAGIVQGNIKDHVANRTLVEITGVDDEKNDDHVEVTIYKGMDPMVESASGDILPFQTQRVNPKLTHAIHRTTGRIDNGVLTTAAIEMNLPVFQISARGAIQLHDMRMRLDLAEGTATGIMGGYSDLDQWYGYFSRWAATSDFLGGISAPTVYQGLRRFADGYKDPATNSCKAISTAYNVKFTRVFVVKPPKRISARADPSSGDKVR